MQRKKQRPGHTLYASSLLYPTTEGMKMLHYIHANKPRTEETIEESHNDIRDAS